GDAAPDDRAPAVLEAEPPRVVGGDAQPPAAIALHQLRDVVQPAVVGARSGPPGEAQREVRRPGVAGLARQPRELALDLGTTQVDAVVGRLELAGEDTRRHLPEPDAVRRRGKLREAVPAAPRQEAVAARAQADHRVDD